MSVHIQSVGRLSVCLLILLTCIAGMGCSDAGKRHAKNIFHEIDDFHRKTAIVGVQVAGVVATALHEPHHHDAHATVQTVYIEKVTVPHEVDDRKRVKSFLDGYYANNNRPIFTFDVKIITCEVTERDPISIRWKITTTLLNDEIIQKCIYDERMRLRDALSLRNYYYPQGVAVIVDVTHGDGSLSQLWGKITW